MSTDPAATSMSNMKLSMLIGTMMQRSKSFTDIHIESDRAVMLRTSANDWMQALDAGQPIIVSHESILAFISGIYTGTEAARPPQGATLPWEREFLEKGSLTPAHIILSPTPDGNVKRHRVRCSIQRQSMGEGIGLVIRALHSVPPSLEALGLPYQVQRMVQVPSGLIVVTGPTGSGKSTSIAGMIESINRSKANNILTIEDPIEFEFVRDKSMINQRELLVDVPSFEQGIKDALRFVPDVIMVGEMRDAATMRAVLRAAESGHLVLTTMHAPTTVSALRKMLAYLNSPVDAHALAGCLIGIVAQGLVQTVAGRQDSNKLANVLAYEVLNCKDPLVSGAITSSGNDFSQVEDRLRTGKLEGSIHMMQSLRSLVSRGAVEPAKAAMLAVNMEDRAEFLRMGMDKVADPKKPAA